MNRALYLSSSSSAGSNLFRSTLLRGSNVTTITSNNSGSNMFKGHALPVSALSTFRSMATFKTTFDLPDPSAAISSSSTSNLQQRPLVKIIATIGPTSEQEVPLYNCVKAGMNSMRLNFSHATSDEVELRCTNLQKAITKNTSDNTNISMKQDVVSILLDTKGPELRTGKLLNDISGHDTIELIAGNDITLHGSNTTLPKDNNGLSTNTDLYIPFTVLASVVQPNRTVLLDDGAIVLNVISTNVEQNTVLAKIHNTGSLRSRAGVNLPLADTAVHLPALSEKDQSDIAYGMSYADIDYVAASFVQTAQHVIDIRQHMINIAQTLPQWKDKPLPLIISKIETASALQHFDDILHVSDGIMVARGDLGVEIPIQQVTNAQKEMVAACNAVGKPVIVATQMLESMTKAPRPTRAEVADVTNAVYDGADCVMLSGETAKGKYPTNTITMMKEIIIAAERYAANTKAIGHPTSHTFTDTPQTIISAVAKAAVAASMERNHNCTAIMVLLQPPTSSVSSDASQPAPYTLPGLIASFRPNVPIYTFCHTSKQARQLSLYRGIYPIIIDSTTSAMQYAQQLGFVTVNDEVVFVEQGPNHGNDVTASMKIVKIA